VVDIVQTINNAISPDALLGGVSVFANGQAYSNWASVSISRGLNSLAGSFNLSFVDKWKQLNQPWPLKPGVLCNVKIGLEPVLTGYIDSLSPSISSNERGFEISGRDRTADLVDCSAVYPTGSFKNQRIEAIAAILCQPFGIQVVSNLTTSTPFKSWNVKQGETVFENLSRAAAQQGALLNTNELGQLYITNRADLSSVSKSTTDLVQGKNLLEVSAVFDDTERFNEYTVKGQTAGDDAFNGVVASQPFGKAVDSNIERYRPLIVFADGSVDTANAQKRANWEATVRSAKALKVNAKVSGWTKDDGTLWKYNEMVFLVAPYVGLNALMLITDVTYNKSVSDGTSTSLSLTRIDAFNPQPVVPKGPEEDAGHGGIDFDLLRGLS